MQISIFNAKSYYDFENYEYIKNCAQTNTAKSEDKNDPILSRYRVVVVTCCCFEMNIGFLMISFHTIYEDCQGNIFYPIIFEIV